MKYNLLGQLGIAGERNPDMSLSDDVATYMYDFPPGQGNNKGASSKNKPVDVKAVEEQKVETALQNPNSYIARKPNVSKKVQEVQEKKSEIEDPGFRSRGIRFSKLDNKEFNVIEKEINTIQDFQNYSNSVGFTVSQRYFLGKKLGIPTNQITNVLNETPMGPREGPSNPIQQLQFENEFIKNYIQLKKENKKSPVDTRTLEQKETDYIKHYLSTGELLPVDFKEENITMADLSGDINYVEQLNNETEFIKSFIDDKVDNSGNKSDDEIVDEVVNESSASSGDGGGPPSGGPSTPTPAPGRNVNSNKNQFNNIPEGADLVEVEGQLYLRYAVPGAGDLYQGSTIFLYYTVKDNDPIKAGFVTPGADYFINAILTPEDLDLTGLIAGNSADLPGNDPRTGRAPHPFTSFAETLAQEATIQPWLLDPDSVALIAEAALEDREVTVAEWAGTNWYKTHTDTERDWLLFYHRDPISANQKANDYKIQIASALRAAGISGGYDSETNQELAAPDALSQWIANKWVTGQWSESYTTEQLALFADPFRSGTRDADFTTYINTAGLGGLNRSAEQEDRIRQLYTQYLGPVFGKLTDAETAEKAGRLRNNPDYESALVESLKTSRVAIFPKYTNPELTYDDIAAPWRGLTRQTWGQEADETQGWWQDMVASNNYEDGQQLLRTKGLEQDISKVNIEATQALTDALGGAAGSVESSFGVNQ